MTRDYGAEGLLEAAEDDPPGARPCCGCSTARPTSRRATAAASYSRSRASRAARAAAASTGSSTSTGSSRLRRRRSRVYGGDRIWWDYRDWTAAMRVPAVVGSWPEPFAHHAGKERLPVRIDCFANEADCDSGAEGRHEGDEASLEPAPPWARPSACFGSSSAPGARCGRTAPAALIERGPERRFRRLRAGRGLRLVVLDSGPGGGRARRRRRPGRAGREGEEQPTLGRDRDRRGGRRRGRAARHRRSATITTRCSPPRAELALPGRRPMRTALAYKPRPGPPRGAEPLSRVYLGSIASSPSPSRTRSCSPERARRSPSPVAAGAGRALAAAARWGVTLGALRRRQRARLAARRDDPGARLGAAGARPDRHHRRGARRGRGAGAAIAW